MVYYMPNLVVYVPAALWKRITELGLDDPKVEARKVAIGALERYVMDGQLTEPEAVGYAAGSGSGEDISEEAGGVIAAPTAPRPERASGSASCPMNTPTGTKCKACGKVH